MGNTGQSGTQTQTGLPWWLECFPSCLHYLVRSHSFPLAFADPRFLCEVYSGL